MLEMQQQRVCFVVCSNAFDRVSVENRIVGGLPVPDSTREWRNRIVGEGAQAASQLSNWLFR